MNIWKSYMPTVEWRIKWRMIIAVIYPTYAVAKRKPEKNSGLYGIRTLDLYGTGAALYQLGQQAVNYDCKSWGDWFRMVYLPAGGTDLFFFVSHMTSNHYTWSFPLCILVFLWRTDTIVCSAKLKWKIRPLSLLSSPSNLFEINKLPGGLNRGFTVCI